MPSKPVSVDWLFISKHRALRICLWESWLMTLTVITVHHSTNTRSDDDSSMSHYWWLWQWGSLLVNTISQEYISLLKLIDHTILYKMEAAKHLIVASLTIKMLNYCHETINIFVFEILGMQINVHVFKILFANSSKWLLTNYIYIYIYSMYV